MSEAEVRRRTGGRSARVRQAVLDATHELVRERGLERFSVAEVAERSGVHETSIYRRWGTREKLVIDALLSSSEELLPTPDTGSLREDLAAMAGGLAEYLSAPFGEAVLQALATVSGDPAVREAKAAFWRRRTEVASVVFERAVARGEMAGTIDTGLALQMLVAPLHIRTLLTHEPISGDLPERIADLVMHGIGRT